MMLPKNTMRYVVDGTFAVYKWENPYFPKELTAIDVGDDSCHVTTYKERWYPGYPRRLHPWDYPATAMWMPDHASGACFVNAQEYDDYQALEAARCRLRSHAIDLNE